MRELTDFDIRLKAAFRRAVDQAGGCIAVATQTGVDKGAISRYGNPHETLMPPSNVLMAVDKLAAEPICLRVMAEQWDMELVPFEDAQNSDADVIQTVAEVAKTGGELQSFALRAASDGHLSPNEKAGIRQRLEDHKDAIRDLDDFTGSRSTIKAVS